MIGSVFLFGFVICVIGFVFDVVMIVMLCFCVGFGIGGVLLMVMMMIVEYMFVWCCMMMVIVMIVCVLFGGMLVGLFVYEVLLCYGWCGLFFVGGVLLFVFGFVLMCVLFELLCYFV